MISPRYCRISPARSIPSIAPRVRSVTRDAESMMPAYGKGSFGSRAQRHSGLSVDGRKVRGKAVKRPSRLPVRSSRSAGAAETGWLTYAGNYAGWRYSELAQINTTNVAALAPAWIFQTRVLGTMETTPLVRNGIMYLTAPSNHAFAIDLRTGHSIWQYSRTPPKSLNLCCGEVNRGFAVLGNRLFKVTIEDTLLALDIATGKPLWETTLGDYRKGYSGTLAPLIVKDKVLVGTAGAEFGIRGFIDAYSPETGERLWRFYTVPRAGEPGGETWGKDSNLRVGGSTWITGTYDPELNLTYWGTGNPGPDMDGDVRPGDNLYTCSLVALDPDTGKLKWHFQFTPHDTHDWDAIGDPVLVDLTIGGRKVKARDPGQPQRPLLRARPHQWKVPVRACPIPRSVGPAASDRTAARKSSPGWIPARREPRYVPVWAAAITGKLRRTVRSPDSTTSAAPMAARTITRTRASLWKASGIN